MATQVLTNAYVLINAVDLSDHVQSVDLGQTVEQQEATAMGPSSDTRITKPGLKDGQVKIVFFQDYAAAKVDATISALLATNPPTTTAVEVRPTNAARSTTNPAWTFTGSISSYNPIAGKVGH